MLFTFPDIKFWFVSVVSTKGVGEWREWMLLLPQQQSRGSSLLGDKWKICSSLTTKFKLLSQIQGHLINKCDYVLVYNFYWGGRCEYWPRARKATKSPPPQKKTTHLVPIYLNFATFISYVYVNSVLHFSWSFILFFFSGASTQFRVMTSPYGTSGSHSLDSAHSVGVLSTSDQPEVETSPWKHTTLSKDRHPCSRRDSKPQSRQASGRRRTPWTARSPGSAWDIKRYYLSRYLRCETSSPKTQSAQRICVK